VNPEFASQSGGGDHCSPACSLSNWLRPVSSDALANPRRAELVFSFGATGWGLILRTRHSLLFGGASQLHTFRGRCVASDTPI
jgi:hypothetical protein